MTKQDGNIHRTETPDVSHIRNVEVTHERSDVNVGGILKFITLLTIMTFAVCVLMWGLFRFFYSRAQPEAVPGPMAMPADKRLPPEPRLQNAKGFGQDLANTLGDKGSADPRDPKWEIRVLHKMWDDNLQHGARGQNGEVIGMPINDAMKRVVETGLPSRVSGPAKFQDFAVSLPTAASSGRTTEKRLQ